MEAIQRYAGKRELVIFLKHLRDKRDRAEKRASQRTR
jgi:hypothetical protein